jgi:hypothetical protein
VRFLSFLVWATTLLAADKLEGRDTGSEGYRTAVRYVMRQFQTFGLKAAEQTGTSSQ